MRLLSFSVVFGMVASASLPLGSINRLPFHVAGLSPSNKVKRSTTLPITISGEAAGLIDESGSSNRGDICSSETSRVRSDNFPSLATVFDCRGGYTLSPVEDQHGQFSAPVKFLGVEMSLFGLKLLLQIGLTILNIACWWLPLSAKSFSQNDNLLALANTFSAGIFLMLAFSHLIPHSFQSLENANMNPLYALKATVLGYLLIFAIDKLLLDSHSLLHEMEDMPIRRSFGIDENNDINVDNEGEVFKDDNNEIKPRPRSFSGASQHSAVVLLIAMAVHSLFETVALGMAPDRTSAIIMATSVALHQPAESLALLIAFLKTSMERRVIARWLALFSIVGPCGVFLGRFIQAFSSPIVEGLLVAVTAGTFLFVGSTEILPESFEDGVASGEKWKRFAALVGGIGSIMLIGSDDHDHLH